MSNHFRLAQTWILAHKAGTESADYEKYSWAAEELIQRVEEEPGIIFQIVKTILSLDTSDLIISQVGAGPLEDLIVRHGDAFIGAIRDEAERSESFRLALGHVWLDDKDTEHKAEFEDMARSKES